MDKSVTSQIKNIQQKCEYIRPLVVIRCTAFNQEPYLRDALEGFVMQKTNFPFVAIVHDDASTDGTSSIIREYTDKYPDIVMPVYETVNQYSKHDGSLREVMSASCTATNAKYIAMCEGDDYWTDPLKLQKQVDFLESHPEYSMCFGNAIEHWENKSITDKQFSYIKNRDYTRLEILENWIVPTATVMYRNEIDHDSCRKEIMNSGKMIAGDIVLFLTCFSYGKVRGFNDVFSVYRRLESGAVRAIIDKNPYRFLIHHIMLGKYFKYDISNFEKKFVANMVVCKLKEIKDNKSIDIKSIKYILRAFWFTPISTIKQITKYI